MRSTIRLHVESGIATLKLARPDCKNALNTVMLLELHDALLTLRRDASVKALILTGEGNDFCAGGDISSMQSDADATTIRARLVESQRVSVALADFNRPVVAAVDGAASGAGFSLALHADFVIASTRARFCLAFSRIGLVPDFGIVHMLPRMIGMQRARELIYSAREISAQEACTLGLVLEVQPVTSLSARATELAQALVTQSPDGFALTKRLLAQSFERDMSALLDAEASAQAVAMTSGYVKEAFARFLRKEPPLFRWLKQQ